MNHFRLLKKLFQMNKKAQATRESVLQDQEVQLREMLIYAYEHSDYYREVFEEYGINATNIHVTPIEKFPIINKEIVTENFNRIVTEPQLSLNSIREFDKEELGSDALYLNQYHIVHSSGSTGKPMYFVYDEAAWNTMLLGIIRAALWDMRKTSILKLLAGGLRIAYIAATDGRYGGAMAVGGGVNSLKGQQLFLDIKTPLDEWLNQLKEFQPNIVIGYPSALKILTRLMKQGRLSLNIKRVISCGEPLNQNLREEFQTIFKVPIVNIYGASESLALGVETDETDGMVLFDDLNYIEVVDGKMLVTSLYNKVQPLIRYEISDQLTIKGTNKGFSEAEIMLSRNEDLLWFKEADSGREDFIHPLAVEGFCIEGMLDYQFRKTSDNTFEVVVEVTSIGLQQEVSKQLRLGIQNVLSEKRLDFVRFTLTFVDQILPNPKTGKKSLIDRSTQTELIQMAV